jgi:hypothetical protein
MPSSQPPRQFAQLRDPTSAVERQFKRPFAQKHGPISGQSKRI